MRSWAPMKVKICAITNLDDALAACEAGADALGFNFAEEAKPKNRHIDPDKALAIIEKLPPFVSTVAVCVNESTERLLEYLEFVERVQLHGEETVEQCRAVASKAIKVFRLGPGFAPESMRDYPASAYLLDAYVEGARGGTGKTCDWDRAREAAGTVDTLILAGGLTPENVGEAVRRVRPYAVDTAGGVERRPGKKDHERVRDFIRIAKTSLS